MNSTANAVIYRFSTDAAFRARVQEDPEGVLSTIEGISDTEREILGEVFVRKPEPTDLADFLASSTDVVWLLPIVDSLTIEE